MKQLLIPGFEGFSPDLVKNVESLEDKGYFWLTDYNGGKLLIGRSDDEAYIPYSVGFPSGRILDEDEIFMDFSKLEMMGFSREEVQFARNFYQAVNHEDTDKDRYKFNNNSFVSEEDEFLTKEKYGKNPFYLEALR